MRLNSTLGTLILTGSLYSVGTLANELEINLVCSFSSKTEILRFDSRFTETFTESGQMGIRVERSVNPDGQVFARVQTMGPKRLQFTIFVPYVPNHDQPYVFTASSWTSKKFNRSNETQLKYHSFSSGRIRVLQTGQSRILEIDRISGIMQGTVIENYEYGNEATDFNGVCNKADVKKPLF